MWVQNSNEKSAGNSTFVFNWSRAATAKEAGVSLEDMHARPSLPLDSRKKKASRKSRSPRPRNSK